jgi:hypothetical protein
MDLDSYCQIVFDAATIREYVNKKTIHGFDLHSFSFLLGELLLIKQWTGEHPNLLPTTSIPFFH